MSYPLLLDAFTTILNDFAVSYSGSSPAQAAVAFSLPTYP